jgi:hypothetical protein
MAANRGNGSGAERRSTSDLVSYAVVTRGLARTGIA